MDSTLAILSVFVLYVLWNEFGRAALRRHRNGSNPLNGKGDFDERLRAIEGYINLDTGRSKAQWEELQRALQRIEREQNIQRQRTHDLNDKHIAPLAGRMEVIQERLLALERWRHGTPDPMLPQGGD